MQKVFFSFKKFSVRSSSLLGNCWSQTERQVTFFLTNRTRFWNFFLSYSNAAHCANSTEWIHCRVTANMFEQCGTEKFFDFSQASPDWLRKPANFALKKQTLYQNFRALNNSRWFVSEYFRCRWRFSFGSSRIRKKNRTLSNSTLSNQQDRCLNHSRSLAPLQTVWIRRETVVNKTACYLSSILECSPVERDLRLNSMNAKNESHLSLN